MPGLKPVEEVLEHLLSSAGVTDRIEEIGIADGCGRVLASAVEAAVDVPPADNSAMDGYALDASGAPRVGEPIDVSQRIPAGRIGDPLEPGTLARIFTGAEMPPGADAVIMQEQVQGEGDSVILTRWPDVGENVRQRGQDIRRNERVVERGVRLSPIEQGLLASVGVDRVGVYQPLRIAIVTTGDELVMPGMPLKSGQIYNSNLFLLQGLIQRLGMQVVAFPLIEDTLEATVRALQDAAAASDCIVSSGGVSVGEEDHVKAAAEVLGQLDIWRINIKPGKPLAFGQVAGKPFFGLPGNPVSTFITFCLFARPLLLKMQGMADVLPVPHSARALFDHKAGSRQEYIRVRHVRGIDGEGIEKYPAQGSGILSSVAWASALAVVAPGVDIRRGDVCDVLLMGDIV